jgi:hypothetical protein
MVGNCCAMSVPSSSLSCASPLTVTDTTTVLMTTDIVITATGCQLIIAGAGFGSFSQDSVIFSSSTANKVIIQDGGAWNPSTFTGENKIIQFAGNAELVIEQGGMLVCSGIFDFIDTSRLIEQQGTTIQLNDGTIRMRGTSSLLTQVP